MNRVRNEEVRRRAGIERELAGRVVHRELRRFGHVEIMDEYRMAYGQKGVDGGSKWSASIFNRPRLGWMADVKVTLCSRVMILEAVWQNNTNNFY